MPSVWDPDEKPPMLPQRLRLQHHTDTTVRLDAASAGNPNKGVTLAWIMSTGIARQRVSAEIGNRVGMPLDDDGCIALHPDDPAMQTIARLEARVKELEAAAPTVAPELTDEQMQALWTSYSRGGAGWAGLRAVVAAYQAMRRPVDNAGIERLARVAYHEYSRLFAKPLKWDEDTYEADRELWRRVARAAYEAMR